LDSWSEPEAADVAAAPQALPLADAAADDPVPARSGWSILFCVSASSCDTQVVCVDHGMTENGHAVHGLAGNAMSNPERRPRWHAS